MSLKEQMKIIEINYWKIYFPHFFVFVAGVSNNLSAQYLHLLNKADSVPEKKNQGINSFFINFVCVRVKWGERFIVVQMIIEICAQMEHLQMRARVLI